MKKAALLVMVALAGCGGGNGSMGAQRPTVIIEPGPVEPLPQARLNKIYVEPGPTMIDGGMRPTSQQIPVDHPFVTNYVLRRPIASEYDPAVRLAVGFRLPDQIRLLPVPSTGYAYTMVNGRLVLVDPNRRRIVRVF